MEEHKRRACYQTTARAHFRRAGQAVATRQAGREDGRKGAGVIYPRCVIKWDLSIIGTIDPSGDCLLLRPVSPHYSCLGVVRWLLC